MSSEIRAQFVRDMQVAGLASESQRRYLTSVNGFFKKKRPDLFDGLPERVWEKDWVAWCQQWGEGQTAVLDYLARYVHRIAIANARIVAMDEHTVTFRYKERKQSRWRTCTLNGHEFMRRFLQHVLPKGLHKVRYYGLWNSKRKSQAQNARVVLNLAPEAKQPPAPQQATIDGSQLLANEASAEETSTEKYTPNCPHCKSANTHLLGMLKPQRTPTNPRASPEAPPAPKTTS